MGTKSTVLYVNETLLQSCLDDLATFAMVVGIIGAGWWMGSEAMQWLGFVMLIVIAFAYAITDPSGRRVTPQQAADRLYAEFGVTAERRAER